VYIVVVNSVPSATYVYLYQIQFRWCKMKCWNIFYWSIVKLKFFSELLKNGEVAIVIRFLHFICIHTHVMWLLQVNKMSTSSNWK
jgi:hypothetical protein